MEDVQRGYCITDFNNTGLLEINRIDDVYTDNSVTDEDCAHQAELDGYCKIIPVDELPENMIFEDNDRRYFGWIDTPENRRAISDYFSNQKKGTKNKNTLTERLFEK